MALDSTAFLVRFPEFDRIAVTLIDAKLAEALESIDPAVWRARENTGHGYLTAHLLAMASQGQQARLVPANAKATRDEALTTYEREYNRLVKIVSSGFRISGPDQTNAVRAIS